MSITSKKIIPHFTNEIGQIRDRNIPDKIFYQHFHIKISS